jgi:hypothetical protein
MMTLFTALEARAISYLEDSIDWSLYTHIEVRILDSVQHGGTHLLYAGEINGHVIDALRALGYDVTLLQYPGKEPMARIDWTNIRCPDSLVCPKEVGGIKNAKNP